MSATAFQRMRREAAKAEPKDTASSDDMDALRELYQETFGKKPFHGWDADTLTAKLDAAD